MIKTIANLESEMYFYNKSTGSYSAIQQTDKWCGVIAQKVLLLFTIYISYLQTLDVKLWLGVNCTEPRLSIRIDSLFVVRS